MPASEVKRKSTKKRERERDVQQRFSLQTRLSCPETADLCRGFGAAQLVCPCDYLAFFFSPRLKLIRVSLNTAGLCVRGAAHTLCPAAVREIPDKSGGGSRPLGRQASQLPPPAPEAGVRRRKTAQLPRSQPGAASPLFVDAASGSRAPFPSLPPVRGELLRDRVLLRLSSGLLLAS